MQWRIRLNAVALLLLAIAAPMAATSPTMSASAEVESSAISLDVILDEFVRAVTEGRTEDYIGHIRFPLSVAYFETSYVDPTTGEARRNDFQERRSASRADFKPFLIHDPNAWTHRVHHLEHAFSGPNTKAIYQGNRMLTFSRVDGRWVLTETRICVECGHPEVLLCARPGRQTEFPGPGPDGNEDFYAFFEVFYYAAHSQGDSNYIPHLSRARTNPDGALARIQFPLRGRHLTAGSGESEEFVVRHDSYFHLYSLFQVDGHKDPPTIKVDGADAYAEVVGAGFVRAINFSRIDGLWYVTGLFVR